MTKLARLQDWYVAHCDGDREHRYGIKIDTLDNPGWQVLIDLADTTLEGAAFAEVSDLEPEAKWIRCWVEDGQFQGVGGGQMLEAILGHFLNWAEGESSNG